MRITFALCLLLAAFLSAAPVQVLPVSGDTSLVNASTLQALVRSAVTKAGFTPTAETSDLQLRPSLMQLGKSYIFVSEKLEKGAVLSSAQQKAESLEELDLAVERAVVASLREETTEQSAEVGSLTRKDEQEISRRKESRQYSSLGLGPATLFGMDRGGLSYMLHGGYIWEAGRLGAITLQNDLAMQPTDWGVHETLLLGGRMHFSATAVSPFLGLGLGLGVAFGDEFRYGFATGASLGVVFFRTSGTQLETALDYGVLFDGRDGGHPASKLAGHLAINY